MKRLIGKKSLIKFSLTLGTAVFLAATFLNIVLGATNIGSDSVSHWAWNDLAGWIDFYSTDSVNVTSQKLLGYASSSIGDVSLDCSTTVVGNICGQSSYGVANDGLGNLSGWGWNDNIGWISFCGGSSTSDCPGGISYKVLIDPATGIFSNYGWNDIIGWVSFNCSNTGGCGTSNYKVQTSWTSTSTSGYLDSSIYDTGVLGGAQINSVLWHGNLPAGTSVGFQFAASNSAGGPWNYTGSDGTGNTYYVAGPDTSIKVDYSLYSNRRYFRYRVTLISNQAQTDSPRVDDVIVNWSP
jgi:hypothetical protein